MIAGARTGIRTSTGALLRLTACCAALGLGSACSRESPATSPEPPDVAAPAPAPAAISRLSVPLEFDFTPVIRIVEEAVPRTFGSMDSVRQMGDDRRRHYAFEATRGPFTAFAQGNRLHLRATLAYSARGFYKPVIGPTIGAGCGKGEQRPRITVELSTPLSLTADWHIVSKASVVRVEPASAEQRDRCDVSFLKKDVTDRIVEAARAGLTSQLGSIDRKIAQVSLADRMAEWWEMLNRPIGIADNAWLLLGPQGLHLGRVTGQSRMLTLPVTLDARPTIVTGTAAPAVGSNPLPPLGRDTAVTDGFHVVMDGLVDYGTASRELTRALSEKSFSEKGHTVTVDVVRVLPQSKGRLSLAVTFSGDAKGTLQLIGTPRIDHTTDVMVVPDLDFDLSSDSQLLQTFSWLKSDDLRAQLRARARLPLGPALERGRMLLLTGMNRQIGDAVTLSAMVDTVAMRSLFVTRDGMVIRAETSGRAWMSVKAR